jgi:hypothetical protein
MVATFLGPGELQVFTQQIQQRGPWRRADFALDAIQGQADLAGLRNGRFLRRPGAVIGTIHGAWLRKEKWALFDTLAQTGQQSVPS